MGRAGRIDAGPGLHTLVNSVVVNGERFWLAVGQTIATVFGCRLAGPGRLPDSISSPTLIQLGTPTCYLSRCRGWNESG